ncbi:MAG: polysaccharide deacetylase family protein [Pseudomonadota bacterium]
MKNGLGAIHRLGLHRLLRPLSQGIGIILTLHRVRPEHERLSDLGGFDSFDPNGLLEVTPDFLDMCIEALKAEGLTFVTLDEVIETLAQPDPNKARVATLTFDDGYIDNATHALPVLEAHNVPATIYMPSDYPQGRGELWWVALERAIRSAEQMLLPHRLDEGPRSTKTAEEKMAAYLDIYWHLRQVDQDSQREIVRDLAAEHGLDMDRLCAELIVDIAGLKTLATHPLITIGAHTQSHRAIAALSEADALNEMIGGANWLEATLGSRPDHFAFPYGDAGSAGPRDFELAKQAGFTSAVTTRKGMLFAEHRDHLFGLPRVSLNGNFQERRFVELYASGAPFLLANKFKKVA